MSKKQSMPPLGKGDMANFETLRRACKGSDLALIRSIRKSDKKPVALVCAMERDGKSVLAKPLAVMIEGNPYEDFEDPTV